MDNTINTEQLVRFIHRETTAAEDHELMLWVLADEQNRRQLRELLKANNLSRLPELGHGIELDREWQKFQAATQPEAAPAKTRYLGQWMKVAASILVLLTVGLGSVYVSDKLSRSQVGEALVQFESPSGEKSKVVLADQTVVWLNSQSTLSYDANQPRKVKLEGEAYFEVTKDQQHPFVVDLKDGTAIRVLGTKFNVRSYPNEKQIETTLEEGKVELIGRRLQQPIEMVPGQQVLLNDTSCVVKEVDSELYSLWRKNELKFRDAGFAELVPRIERWYGVQIDMDPNLGSGDYFTMTIKTESIRELFQMMQLTSNFNYEITGSRVRLTAQ